MSALLLVLGWCTLKDSTKKISFRVLGQGGVKLFYTSFLWWYNQGISQREGVLMKDYKNIWESFVRGIEFDQNLIKRSILNSWKRCKRQNISLYEFDESILMKPKDKREYVLKYLPEYREARYRDFCSIVEYLGLNISIYDHNARLKYIVNYDDVFDDLYPRVGYFLDASEDKIGTNSTSMALLENKPFMVTGSDHYKYVFHKFSCAAAPFYSENNQVSGTINASFTHTSVNKDTLNIIYSLARLYENLVLNRVKSEKDERPVARDERTGEAFYTFDHILGDSVPIKQAKSMARRAAVVDSSIIIYGESGSGKEVFAQAIHHESRRRDKPFVAVNCAAIPTELIESELFGYEKGSFTGAVKEGKKGLFEYASGGTLFLDEVESMPLPLQAKILRALSSSSIMRVGGYKPIPVDIRLIAASKKDLQGEVKKGNFREDLYYRINVIQLQIPALRHRKEDIGPIAEHYIKTFSDKNKIRINRIEDQFFRYLEAYDWPGNVRELINIIERSLVLSEKGIIDQSVLSPGILEHYTIAKFSNDLEKVFSGPLPEGKTLLKIAEEIIIERVVKEEGNNMSAAAKRLGISRPTLYKKLKRI